MKSKKVLLVAALAAMAGVMGTSCGGTKVATTPQQAVLSLKEQQAAEQQKMYTTKIAEYKKEGWKLAGSTKTLEVALLDHYVKLYDDQNSGNKELIGEVSQCKSINVCRQMATNNAITFYANLANSTALGRVTSALNADANAPSVEIDNLQASYERLVKAEIQGALTESFAIVKEEANGNRQYKLFFIVNEAAASATRARAMENALKDTKMSQETAREISNFVREGFEISQ
jgi:hypothetical protein